VGTTTGVNNITSSAELYDPRTGMWTNTGPMSTARTDDTATLLPNGKFLVAGGEICCTPFRILSSAELYDPRTGTWTDAGDMSTAREEATATLLPDGDVLITGGGKRGDLASENHALSSAELYRTRTPHRLATARRSVSNL
jgi:hypothetical protein